MTTEIESLLALLNDEKAFRQYVESEGLFLGTDEHWADLAFRLRDEAMQDYSLWQKAKGITSPAMGAWGDFAQPKHFIVAALIARKLKESQEI